MARRRRLVCGGDWRLIVRAARRYRTIEIQAGPHMMTAQLSPVPGDARALQALREAHAQVDQVIAQATPRP